METCKCKDWNKWFVQRFGQNSFIILCSRCGKNATEAARNKLGINTADDDYEMAVNHLTLAHAEHLAHKVTNDDMSLVDAIRSMPDYKEE